MTEPPRAPVLVIGVGSELRSDDAVGRRVADALAERHLLGVDVRSVHQLTPEIAADMVGRELVVVVDASLAVDRVTVRRVHASATTNVVSHHVDIEALLAMTGLLGDPPVAVATVAIPAHDLRLGTEPSARAASAIAPAVEEILALAEDARSNGPTAS